MRTLTWSVVGGADPVLLAFAYALPQFVGLLGILARQCGLSKIAVDNSEIRRHVRCALERIIEQAGDVEVNANAVVAAVAAYSKLNANGQWIDRRETVNLNDLFSRMSENEMLRYASAGELPTWFSAVVGATQNDSQADGNGE